MKGSRWRIWKLSSANEAYGVSLIRARIEITAKMITYNMKDRVEIRDLDRRKRNQFLLFSTKARNTRT